MLVFVSWNRSQLVLITYLSRVPSTGPRMGGASVCTRMAGLVETKIGGGSVLIFTPLALIWLRSTAARTRSSAITRLALGSDFCTSLVTSCAAVLSIPGKLIAWIVTFSRLTRRSSTETEVGDASVSVPSLGVVDPFGAYDRAPIAVMFFCCGQLWTCG